MAGLYLHIPFCVKKCRYCDFVSFAAHDAMESYLLALDAEMALVAAELPARSFDTVFFGGGTPSILPLLAVERLMEGLRRRFSIATDAEISFETNPGTLSAEKLREYRSAGVNRLSMGLQSANDGILARIGRIHGYADFLASLDFARAAGFSNINVDIMYGLPGQSLADHADTLAKVAGLDLVHISAYSLILAEGTPLYAENPALPDEDESYAMHRLSIEYLQSRGYGRYEISNYAKPGMACRHNLNYWENGEYLGLGLGSHSAMHLGGWRRFCNTENLAEYLGRVGRGERPVAEDTPIPRTEEMFECLMLGLRKTAGLKKAAFLERFGEELGRVYEKAIAEAKAKDYLVETEADFRLTDRGLDMQNEALLLFL